MPINIESQIIEMEQRVDFEALKHFDNKQVDQRGKVFQNKILKYNALACCEKSDNKDDLANAFADSQNNMQALNAQNSLQEMLIAQMTSIHLLQQRTVALANRTGLVDAKQFLINSSIKLTNCFIQQAALLAKLQGTGGQKIIVEHVEVHNGGQAIVGNISGATSEGDIKK